MDVVSRKLDIGRADEDVIDIEFVIRPVEVEGHVVGGVACISKASFQRAVFNNAIHFDCDIFDGVTDGNICQSFRT